MTIFPNAFKYTCKKYYKLTVHYKYCFNCFAMNKNIYFDVFTNIIKHKVLVYHFKGSVIVTVV